MSKSNTFTQVKTQNIVHNTFDLSHDTKHSFNMGELVPNLLMEVLPTDRISINSNHLVRLAPMLAPIMHQVDVYQHFWFCPNRILWSNWNDFITAGVDGTDSPAFPTVNYKRWLESSIPDNLGIPNAPENENKPLSALPFAMYVKIWNEFYRDQTLQTEKDVDLVDGDNSALINASGAFGYPFKRAWTQDYFTSCLPFPQRGPQVTLPLGTFADIIFDQPTNASILHKAVGGNVSAGQLNAEAPDQSTPRLTDDTAAFLSLDISASHRVDLSSALAASINDLRLSFAVQSWLELNARTGARYSEYLKAHWKSFAGDSTLQRPVYLGGSKTPLIISEVLQTSETNTTPQGTMAGRAISVSDAFGFSYTCTEHGYIMGLVSIMPKPAYFQGMPKHWHRFDKFDYYEPLFANLGEQAVLQKEIFYSDIDGTDLGEFGYQSRWAEYKDIPSSIHGAFRTSLLFWNMAREFASFPNLNGAFIECDATERIFAVQSIAGERLDHVWALFHHNILARRPLPVFSIPSLL